MSNVDESIRLYRDALALHPEGHPERLKSLSSLADDLWKRYQQKRQAKDLEEAITLNRAALASLSDDHPDRPTFMNNLAKSLRDRYSGSGRMEDLQEAIALYRAALVLCPQDHPDRSEFLNNLATCLGDQYARSGQVADLEEAITLNREALALHPEGHAMRPQSLNNLALNLRHQYARSGKIEDLEEAITLSRAALALCPEGDPDRLYPLGNLAAYIRHRYVQAGRMEDLEESVVLNRAALDLCPEGHPMRARSLNNLAMNLRDRFSQSGQLEDLEEAIVLSRAALALCPEGHPNRAYPLGNLAAYLRHRYIHSRQMKDLEEAIMLDRAALTLCPKGHSMRPYCLNNLALKLRDRYSQTGQMNDLEEAIVLNRDALALCPEGHAMRSYSLNSLALSLHDRYSKSGQLEDLEEAITLNRAALVLHPEGHSMRSLSLNNLALNLRERYSQSGLIEDLEEAVALNRAALALRPEGHPDRSASLRNLATDLRTVQIVQNKQTGPEDPVWQLWESAAAHSFSSLLTRLEAAVSWSTVARSDHHPSTLRAYKMALSLLERTLTICPTVQMQHDLLSGKSGYPTLVSDAVSYAIECGELTQAVEMLEQGRALIWSQMRGLRTPSDRLAGVNKELAEEFTKTSRELEALVTSSESGQFSLEANNSRTAQPSQVVDQMYSRRRILAERLEKTIKTIQTIPAFEDFLQAPRFSALQKAAIEGPVIIVTHSAYRSDALIILYDRPPVCVNLDSDFDRDSASWTRNLKEVLEKIIFNPVKVDRTLDSVLKFLWKRVVSLVVDKLDELGVEKQSRIWWCPTSILTALPFHAAGPIPMEGRKRKYLHDDYVSSYTPTLAALINARSGIMRSAAHPPFLVISQLDESLPQATNEVRAIQKGSDWVECLTGEQATREVVLDKLRDHHWIHLACHGNLKPGEPFDHWFSLYNHSRLTLLDIVQSQLPNAELAFLSACHSAEQSIDSAHEEVLHLAAGMQFCGYRSVVGTMWAMEDEDGPFVAEEFYKYMFQDEGSPEEGFQKSARALCKATRRLRRSKGMTLERWVNFIHIGA